MSDYEKIGPQDGLVYERVRAVKDAGRWICDSVDHNEDGGCSNPECFKYSGKKDD
jgi:hypothetical protein